MSADTTIAVFRFNDGKCRVGLVQAIENFTGFQWGKSRFGDRERDTQMLGYRACRSLQVALSAATRIFLKDADIVQHGVEVIDLPCPYRPDADAGASKTEAAYA